MIVTFFRPETGELTAKKLSGPKAFIAKNTPAGLASIEGEHDHRTKRVNLTTLTIEDKPSEA